MAQMMAFAPLIMSVAGSLFQGIGASSNAAAAREIASRRKTASEFEAAQLDSQAIQSVAAAQRVAADRRRDATLVQSRALAVAAASGGGVSDPTIVNLLGKVAGEGAYRANIALYEGEERARSLRMGAASKRYEGETALEMGEASAKASQMAGAGAILKGLPGMFTMGSSLFSKYGGNGPGTTGPSGDSSLIGGFGDGFGVGNVG